MARLDEYVLGYYKGRVDREDICKLVNAFLKLAICSEITPDGHFSLRRRDRSDFSAYAKTKLRFELSSPLGAFGALLRLRYCYGLVIALILSAFIFAFSCGRVWDVRIDGNNELTDAEIETSLSSYGLGIGAKWRGVHKNELENAILLENPGIAWISVNRRGTVAYVQIIESENIGGSVNVGPEYSNIIADRDAVIEEITVESGVATVKAGDVVRAGDVLISGVVENEKGVTFLRAKGSVRASAVTSISAEATEKKTERVVISQKLRHVRLIIFNFSINIFKNYGNCENSCDIIKENRKIALFDKFRLPIRLERIYTAEYEQIERTLTPDEMTSAAQRELDGKIYSMFRNADIVKLRTESAFDGSVYRITARVVYSTDIGKESAIEIN